MKLATFVHEGVHRLGAIAGDEVVDLSAHDRAVPADMGRFLALGAAGLDAARRAIAGNAPRHPRDTIVLSAPVPSPAKVFGIGLNYTSFVSELRALAGAVPPQRIWFGRQQACIVGPNADVWMPLGSSQLDYEGELAIIIGASCRGVTAGEAHAFIAGYTVCNDLTVRDWAAVSPLLGKSFATHAPMGPWLVTADEIDDPQNLTITTSVNGTTRQSASTAEMLSNCYELVAELSAVTTLEPGDVILSGTPGGCGSLHRPAVFLRPGDRVCVSIDGIGEIANRIVSEPLQ